IRMLAKPTIRCRLGAWSTECLLQFGQKFVEKFDTRIAVQGFPSHSEFSRQVKLVKHGIRSKSDTRTIKAQKPGEKSWNSVGTPGCLPLSPGVPGPEKPKARLLSCLLLNGFGGPALKAALGLKLDRVCYGEPACSIANVRRVNGYGSRPAANQVDGNDRPRPV